MVNSLINTLAPSPASEDECAWTAVKWKTGRLWPHGCDLDMLHRTDTQGWLRAQEVAGSKLGFRVSLAERREVKVCSRVWPYSLKGAPGGVEWPSCYRKLCCVS